MKRSVGHWLYKKNGAKAEIFAVRKLKGVPACDTLLFQLTPAKGEPLGFYLRPDEALLIARLLIDGVNRTTRAYLFGLQRGPNKY